MLIDVILNDRYHQDHLDHHAEQYDHHYDNEHVCRRQFNSWMGGGVVVCVKHNFLGSRIGRPTQNYLTYTGQTRCDDDDYDYDMPPKTTSRSSQR